MNRASGTGRRSISSEARVSRSCVWGTCSRSSVGCENTTRSVAMTGGVVLLALVIFLVVVGLFIYFVTVYNSLVRLRNDMDKAWANIDVLLKQRHDELPKLIETCKGYMQYEQKTFQLVVEEIGREENTERV